MASSVLPVHIPAATARCRVVSSIGSPASNSSGRASKHTQHSYTYDAMLGGTPKATAISSLVCTSSHWLSACGPLSSVSGHRRECPSPTAIGAAPAQRDSISSVNRAKPSAEGHRSSSLSRGRTSRSDSGTALRSDAPADRKVAMSERRMREGVEVVDSRDINNEVTLPTSGKTLTGRSQVSNPALFKQSQIVPACILTYLPSTMRRGTSIYRRAVNIYIGVYTRGWVNTISFAWKHTIVGERSVTSHLGAFQQPVLTELMAKDRGNYSLPSECVYRYSSLNTNVQIGVNVPTDVHTV